VTWKDTYLESRVLSADPLELICLLYQHALDMVHEARGHLAAGDIAARSRAISRAIAAISELDASLDHAVGGQFSSRLAGLYRYMRQRLTEANLRQQDAPLAEVASLLATLAEGWNASRIQAAPPQPSYPAAFVPSEAVFAESATYEHNWSA
jgi:flagellar secretion chaperone FliS